MDLRHNEDETRGLPPSRAPLGADGGGASPRPNAPNAHAKRANNDASEDTDIPDAPGVSDYELLNKIGSGGFGEVWIGRSAITHKLYAVKALSPFEQIELQSLRAVLSAVADHPNLVAINHVGRTEQGRLYIVMPLADNTHSVNPLVDPRDYRAYTLERHAARAGRLSAKEAARIGASIADALAHMHRQGVAHGDVKPQNVLRFDGEWRLGDYSLVVFPEERSRRGFTRGYSPDDDRPYFEADLHMLGATLLTLIGRSTSDLRDLLTNGAEPPSDEDRDLMRVIRWLCAPHTPGAPRSASDAAAALRDISGEKPPRRPLRVYVGAAALIAVVATLLSAVASRPLFTQWTPINELWWGWLRAGGTAAAPAAAHLDNIVVIAMRDESPLNDLGRDAGLEGVDTSNLRSLRRLHGELCRRLVRAKPAAVVWDIYFATESEFDADLASGIEALLSGGVGVVVTSYRWRGESGGAPPVASRIWGTGARWGSNHVQMDPSGAIWIPLVASLPDSGTLPSLVLAAHASAMRPDAWFDASIDERANEAVIRYWRPLGDRPDRRTYVGPDDRVRLTLVQPFEQSPARGRDPGLRRGDVLGYIHASPAPIDALERVTLNYEDVFRMPADDLHRRLRDRVVLVGDFRSAAGDVVTVPGRGRVYGPHLLASAIAQVRAQATAHTPQRAAWLAGVFGFTAVMSCGALALLGRGRGSRRRMFVGAAALIVAALVIPASVALFGFRSSGVLASPFPAALASLLAVMFAAALVASPWWASTSGRMQGVIR